MINYIVSAYNEDEQLDELLPHIQGRMGDTDTLIVVLDSVRMTEAVENVVKKHEIQPLYFPFDIRYPDAQIYFIKAHCENNFIFLLSADETPHEFLMANLHALIINNPRADGFAVPRVNIISDLTPENVAKMYVGHRGQEYLLRQRRNKHGWIAWPDFQARIIKNVPYITYGDHPHAGMVGFNRLTFLPAQPEYGLHHVKTVAKQSQSNRICDLLE